MSVCSLCRILCTDTAHLRRVTRHCIWHYIRTLRLVLYHSGPLVQCSWKYNCAVGVCVFRYSQQDSCRPYGNSICPPDAMARESCAGHRPPAPRSSSFVCFTAADSVSKRFILANRSRGRKPTTSKPHRRGELKSSQAQNTVSSGATWPINLPPFRRGRVRDESAWCAV